MRLTRAKRFDKEYRRFPQKLRSKIDEKIVRFAKDPFDPVLKNHILHGEFEGCRSISLTGNIRAIYILIAPDTALFLHIGTHHELYGT